MAQVFRWILSSFTKSTTRAMEATQELSRLPEAFRPPVNRQMKELDRGFFVRSVSLAAIAPLDGKHIATIKQKLTQSHDLLNIGRVKHIRHSADSPSGKCLLLRPEIEAATKSTWSAAITKAVDEDHLAVVQPYVLQMTYDDWNMQDILLSVIPEEDHDEIPAGFAQVGHVAHVNIREQYLPYRYLIAQVLLDKNPKVRTVINKTDDVGTESIFRTFPYEVLAGPDDMDVTVSHNDCTFRFNFAKVYWNTRLNTEHTRIMDKFQPGEAVCDVMAGVGPFAVPSGKRKVFIWANDLNPDSHSAMDDAIKINKVGQFVKAFCADGREFIKQSAKDLLLEQRTARIPVKAPKDAKVKPDDIIYQEPPTFDHYVMNLPATAVEFLDAFKGVYSGHEDQFAPATARKLPMVHVYMFSANELDAAKEAQSCCVKVSHHLGHQITPDTPEVEVFDVRLVSPKKKMFCVSFRLPAEIAFSK